MEKELGPVGTDFFPTSFFFDPATSFLGTYNIKDDNQERPEENITSTEPIYEAQNTLEKVGYEHRLLTFC